MAERIVLDVDQAGVVGHVAGPLLALGSPGTGKTTTLVERFVALSKAEGCSPDRVLFLVANRASKIALRDRLARRLLFEEGFEALIDVPVYTWHGLAHHLVTRHYDLLGYSEPPVLLTSPEQWGTIRDELAEESAANWPHHRHLLGNRGFVDEVVDFCIRAEQRLLDDSDLAALTNTRPAWGDLVRFFKAHRVRMRSRSRIDYPTLLSEGADLLARYEDVRESLHDRFTHLLVDDGQELALVQQRILYFLGGQATEGRSLVLAGDPDSAIETFRGAEPEWIDDFSKEFGTHETITLATNYRASEAFGERLTTLIERNGPRDHRATDFTGSASLEVRRFGSLATETEAIARMLRLAHLEDKIPYEDMAILLTSARSMLPPLSRSLDNFEVPFSISAPDRPLGREPVVRTFADLAMYAFAAEPDPDRMATLLRSPLIDVNDVVVRELERLARIHNATLTQVVERPPELDPEALEKLTELHELRDLLRAKKDAPADEAFWVVWDRSSYCSALVEKAKANLDDPAHRDLDALVAFSRALGRYVERRRGQGTLGDYIKSMERADFGSDPWLPPERAGGGVSVVSFHGAKGKEWAVVAVAGVVDGAIPKGRRATGLFDSYFLDETDAVARARKNEMEDRRVFYIATTRATTRCIVTTSPGPTRRGEPSRFIGELTGSIPDIEAPEESAPLTFSEAAARYRRTLANVDASPAERIAALAGVKKVCELDPGCSTAQPAEWWWRWDWTEGAPAIRIQQADPDDDLPLDKLRTSYSRISTYDNCGLQYLFSVVLGFDPDTSHNMFFGSWVHTIFEEDRNRRAQQQGTGRGALLAALRRGRLPQQGDRPPVPPRRRDHDRSLHRIPETGGGSRCGDLLQGRARWSSSNRTHRSHRQGRQEPDRVRLQDLAQPGRLG